jgi:uncharacterized protein (DUF1501 family)
MNHRLATQLWSRRDVLRVGSISVAASLAPSAAALAARSGAAAGGASARSVILLWMAGGVTHIDSLDPKPDAPEEVRGTLGAVRTTTPGTIFCETMPRLAEQAQHLAVVRSYSHDSNDHFLSQAFALSGRRVTMSQITTEPNVGSIAAKLHGARAGFPGYIAVPGTTRPGPPPKNLFTGGWLGRQYDPFSSGGTPRNEDFTAKVREPDEEEFNLQSLQLVEGLDASRLVGRRTIRQRLDDGLQRLETAGYAGVLADQYKNAFEMLTSPAVRDAFDLRKESGATRERYGRTKIGSRCLLARRLVEAGAPFVMVDYGYDPEFGNLWDNHRVAVQNQPHICDIVKLPYHLAGTDRAFAALIGELAERGRLAETLVVFLTEFGRTPKINSTGGRDHWGAAGSIFFAGGGTRGGQVIGSTDKHAAYPTSRGYTPADVAATIYQAIGVDPHAMLHDRQNRPIAVLPEGDAIAGVLGG